jgi:hypothetical protein
METTQYFQQLHLQPVVVAVAKTPLAIQVAQAVAEPITVAPVALHLLPVKVMPVELSQVELIAAQAAVAQVQ